MSKAAKRGLKTADNYRYIAVGLSYSVAVDNNGSVRPESGFSSGRISVRTAPFLGNGVVCNH